MIEYTNHMCWIKNTYYVPMEVVPEKHGEAMADARLNSLDDPMSIYMNYQPKVS